MGIYSNSLVGQINEYSNGETLESIMEDESIQPNESSDIIEGSLDAIQIMQENYNSIFMHIGTSELAVLEETGESMVYTEGVLSNIWNAIKTFLKKIWEKIKGLFKRFMMIIDSYAKNDKDFLNKYRTQILSANNLKDFEFKGYKWNETAFTNTPKVMEDLAVMSAEESFKAPFANMNNNENAIDKKLEEFDEEEEVNRGVVINKLNGKGSSNKYTSSEFVKELREVYRSGDSEKQDLDSKDISPTKIVGELASSKDIKKGVADAFKACKKSIEDDEKYVDKKQNEFMKNSVPGDKNKSVVDYSKNDKDDDYASYSALRSAANSNDQAAKDKLEFIDRIVDKLQRAGKTKGSYNGFTYSDFDDLKNQLATKVYHGYGTSKETEVAGRTTKYLQYLLKEVRSLKEMLLQVNSAYLNAWKERSRQNKAIAIKLVAHSPKKEESDIESYTESYSGNSFLANIQLK